MNLRKDHCRNLPSRTTRERVNQTPRGSEDAFVPRAPPQSLGVRDRGFASPSGRVRRAVTSPVAKQRTPGVNRAKEPYNEEEHVGRCRPVRGVRADRLVTPFLRKSKTTLGNGYLGSRIDEERSEMRYLV